MRKLSFVAAVGIAVFAVFGAMIEPAAAGRSNLDRQLQKVKAATARYHSVHKAIAAGYLPPPPDACVSSPAGGMGYHFENPALMEDAVIDPLRPEMLMYERKPNGKFRLIGVEYYVEADQASSAPVLFGQTFQGPMPAHHPAMEEHYDLHAWIWKKNPSGMFAEWNPRVSCP